MSGANKQPLIPIDSSTIAPFLGNPTNGVAAVIRYICNSRDLGMKNNYSIPGTSWNFGSLMGVYGSMDLWID